MNHEIDSKYAIAVQTIKSAILQSQYMAIKLVNKEQLALYYGIGRYPRLYTLHLTLYTLSPLNSSRFCAVL